MKYQSVNDDVTKILDEAPNARKALMENYDNLLKVAEYCHDNYLQSGDDSMKALEETKNFTTQSLASIAYQISTLATSVLSLFDAQTNQLRHMESSINLIGQTVEMHKEKVSRREIGLFTAVRRVPRSHKILPPPQPPAGTQPRPPYSRQPINYQQLDSLGHSMKVCGKQPDTTETMRKHRTSIRSNNPPEPVQCPVAPPVSSFGKPVAPPTIPNTWQTPPEGDIIMMLLDEAPPSPPMTMNKELAQDDEVMNISVPPPPPPPPDSPEGVVAPPNAPPSPPPSSEDLTNHSTPPPAPPPTLETVVEENIFPPPSPPPPPSDDDSFPLLSNDVSELPAPPTPRQEVDVTLPTRRSCRRRSPPTTRSLSLRVRSGPASRCRYTRSLFLPAVQSLMIPPPPPYPPPRTPPPPPSSSLPLLPRPSSSSPSSIPLLPRPLSSSSSPRLCLPARLEHLDLEIPAPPPSLLLDDEGGLDDIMPPLPPPVDYDSNAPPHYLDKVVVLYSYEASKPDDLSLTEGDIIYLTHHHNDGWCEGFLNGNQGFFPESYVQSLG
ncbi:ABI family, member 3a isoform X1 [Scophthalmus maximus]|uniref:ABI family, member 3a isoform X1 n=2 Tax=Scophthalmus maximus TaxID=52904 RepID=UPI001FA8C19F|nr:ABI family, member 3a isoform X1 [Scophthalmus maximus]